MSVCGWEARLILIFAILSKTVVYFVARVRDQEHQCATLSHTKLLKKEEIQPRLKPLMQRRDWLNWFQRIGSRFNIQNSL